MKKFARPLACLTLIMFVSGCATAPDAERYPAGSAPLRVSSKNEISEEVSIGEQIHEQILSSFYVYTDPYVVNYINEIGRILAAHSERSDLPYKFTVLYNDKIYAASAPGGFIYLTTGMLNFLDNEAELAAVLAHEIGQIQYPDPRLSESRKVLDAVTRGASYVSPAFGQIGMLAMLGLVLIHTAVDAADLTPEEKIMRADARALAYMAASNFDPQGMIDFLYRFLEADRVLRPYMLDYYQARPITMERFRHLDLEFSKLPLAGRHFSTGRQTYQEVTKGIQEIYAR